MRLQFPHGPPPRRHIRSLPVKAAPVIDKWLEEALREGDVEPTATPPRVVSPIFVIPKKAAGEWRLIFDLRYVNKFLTPPRFKLESLSTAINAVTPNSWFTKTDLRSGYSHILVNETFRTYLGFSWRDQHYVYKVLPFGLSVSPWIFTKLLKPAIRLLRSRGVKICAYVDDILVVAESKELCQRHTCMLRNLLDKLGWLVRPDKSSPEPTQSIEFLGFKLDSVNHAIRLPRERRRSTSHELFRFVKTASSQPVNKRVLARVLGLANSTTPAIPLAPMFCRRAIEILKQSGPGRWDSSLTLTEEATDDLFHLAEIIRKSAPRSLARPNPTVHVQTDASLLGFGSVNIDTGQTLSGSWADCKLLQEIPTSSWSINLLELLAAFLAVKSHSIPNGSTVSIQLDNATAVAYLMRFTGRVPALAALARRIQEWCCDQNVLLVPGFIPGAQNVVADRESRRAQDWRLCPKVFRRVCSVLQLEPTVDRFASSQNHQLPRWNSRTFHPDAEAVDGLRQRWSDEVNYLAPPLPILDRAIVKAIGEGAEAIVITPPWERPWLPLLLMKAAAVVRLPADCLMASAPPFESSSGYVLAWKISGQDCSATSTSRRERWWRQIVQSRNWQVSTPNSALGF